MPYIAVAGSAIGPAHLSKGRPCEDSFATRCSRDGWTSAVVCDGCGSVGHALEGAQFISEYVAARLVDVGPNIAERGLGEWTYSPVVAILGELRDEMRSRFGRNIGDYAATIVAALASDDAGILVHMGDGIASGFTLAEGPDGTTLALSVQSQPENGEYINETFYVTDPVWLPHLRITPIRRPDCLLLCSDGAQSLFFEGNEPAHRTIIWFLRELHQSGERASKRFEGLLRDAEATKRSDDDKTAVLLIAEDAWDRLGMLSDAPMPMSSRPQTPRLAVAPSRTQSRGGAAAAVPKEDLVARLEKELSRTRRLLAIARRQVRRQRLAGAIVLFLVAVAALGYSWVIRLPEFFVEAHKPEPTPTPTQAPAKSLTTERPSSSDSVKSSKPDPVLSSSPVPVSTPKCARAGEQACPPPHD